MQCFQVVDVIANVGHLLAFEFVEFDQLFEHSMFVHDALVAEVELEFGRPVADDFGLAAGDDAHEDAGLLQVADDVAVLHVELLGLAAGVVIDDAPIGEHAIDIKKKGLDVGSLLNLLFRVLAEDFFYRHG